MIRHILELSDVVSFLDHLKDHFSEEYGWNHKEKVIIHAVIDDITSSLIEISEPEEGDTNDSNTNSSS